MQRCGSTPKSKPIDPNNIIWLCPCLIVHAKHAQPSVWPSCCENAMWLANENPRANRLILHKPTWMDLTQQSMGPSLSLSRLSPQTFIHPFSLFCCCCSGNRPVYVTSRQLYVCVQLPMCYDWKHMCWRHLPIRDFLGRTVPFRLRGLWGN